ncbi:L-threonylcarbamoyladenylate synthase [Algiphilus sp.]|uniref:L-threonylcarbamoyladenylate synthase n=1 Tax=Algiphilus sp. TaxID=1872431 RepID=UPI0032EC3A6B
MIHLGADSTSLAHAARLLRDGQLVAFPTETVYGLGGDAANPEAVASIFRAKGRPADHPVIVHMASADALPRWASHVPESAQHLAEAFWPGPLTLVLRRADGVSDAVTGGQDTVGLRVPGNPVALDLLRAFGGALAAPSANRFGHVSPTTAAHVLTEFGDSEVAAVVDGGPCRVGVESTIIDLSGARPALLRHGMIAIEAIEAVLNEPLERVGDQQGPRASGRLASHYAPRAVVELVAVGALEERVETCLAADESIAVLARRGPQCTTSRAAWIEMPDQPAPFAQALYSALRQADAACPDRILVERPPDTAGWEAISDRLQKASTPRSPISGTTGAL